MRHDHYDAVIVGARVAGSATARILALAGARVLLVDRGREIGDTISTHALMRPAVALLGRWGLIDRLSEAGTPWVRAAQFQYGADCVTVPIRPDGSALGLLAPRRWLLDGLLCDSAVDAGAELSLGTAFETCLMTGDGRVIAACLRRHDGTPVTVSTGLLVGADGLQSRVASAVAARTLETSTHRTATVYVHAPGHPNAGYRWFFGDGVTAGIIPTTGGDSCIFASCRPGEYGARFGADPVAGLAATLDLFDAGSGARLRAARITRTTRFPGANGIMRARTGKGWALVGDAAMFRDPVTAHGITDALLDADALSASVLRGDPDAYGSVRAAEAAPLFAATQEIAGLDWNFDRLKALHARLNACLKSEQARIAGPEPAVPSRAALLQKAAVLHMEAR